MKGNARILSAAIGAILAVVTAGAGSAGAAPASRCLQVPPFIVATIATGLTHRGEHLRAARAVRSRDFKRLYFVAADIQGPGMNSRTEIGVWATNRLTTYGTFMAVDGFAQQFTDWQHGDQTDAHVTLGDDGALESRACVRNALR